MASAYLINTVTGTFGTIVAGTEMDDASSVATAVRSVGGILVPASNTTIADAAAKALRHARRGQSAAAEEVMQAALGAVAPQTIHFDVGNIGTPAVAGVPGTPDADAMAVFGQLNNHLTSRIAAIHFHLIVPPSSGQVDLEVFKRYDGSWTLLTQHSLDSTSPAFEGIDAQVPSAANELAEAGAYFFCQVTEAGGITAGNADGITIDIHFKPFE